MKVRIMTLKAKRYPDVWEFSDEHPSPKNIPTWVDSKTKVKEFVEVFLSPQFFEKLIFWRYPEYAGASYFINKGADFRVIDYLSEAEEVRYGIEDIALKGHLCVLFVPLNSNEFIKKILSTGHYGESEQITVGNKKKGDPLDWQSGQTSDFFNLYVFRDSTEIFGFSHDAEFLYEIFK